MKNFRKARWNELSEIMGVIEDGKRTLKERGVDQWANDGPTYESIQRDLKKEQLYVLVENNEILGVCACVLEEDPNYQVIDGAWLQTGPYMNIHRFAVSRKHQKKNLGTQMLRECLRICPFKAVRIDTHHDNQAMLALVQKVGFQYCGVIRLSNGEPRDAFELVIS